MQAAWYIIIISLILSLAAAIEAGILTNSGIVIKRLAFIILLTITGVGFLFSLIAMGLATAANDKAGEILSTQTPPINNETFSFNIGWYALALLQLSCPVYILCALCAYRWFMILGFFSSFLAFAAAGVTMLLVHKRGDAAAPVDVERESSASARRVTKNPVEDFA
jgi:hypothetical protein